MYDKPLIFALILVVLAGIASPFIYARMSVPAGWPPRLAPPPNGEKECVEPKEYMREHHVDVLKRWREARVREGTVKYVASDGKEYVISLTETCMRCHSNKADFCDRCHDSMQVRPRCWECHTFPQKGEAAK